MVTTQCMATWLDASKRTREDEIVINAQVKRTSFTSYTRPPPTEPMTMSSSSLPLKSIGCL